jgi:hypothetical protein
MRFPAILAAALLTVAGAAQAQNYGSPTNNLPCQPMQSQAQMSSGMGRCGHTVSITDEYGFRYDNIGNRLNARGCVIAPPVTPPGARAIQNGR